MNEPVTYDEANDDYRVDASDVVWTAAATPESEFRLLVRELGLRETLLVYLRRRVCRLVGHDWRRETYFESWDVGVGFEEEWWECDRCERLSYDEPTRWRDGRDEGR